MLLSWCWSIIILKLNVNERYNFALKFVFGCLNDNDEFLTQCWTDLDSDVLLKLLRHWVLNEPALMVYLRV